MGRGNRTASIACTSKAEDSLSGPQGIEDCRVCGASGARFHYGSISCNGCRNFFRRSWLSIYRNNTYKCMQVGNCSTAHGTRRACRSCRLARCLQEGMDSMLVEGERERKTRSTDIFVASARELMKRQAMGKEEAEIDDELPPLDDIQEAPNPLQLRLFAHAAVVQHLIDQEHWAEQLGSSGTGYHGLDDGRLFRTDLSFKAVFRDPGIAVVRTPICWEKRRILQPSNLPFLITRGVVFCIDWANLLSDFYALSMSDREILLRARGTVISFVMHVGYSYFCFGGDDLLLFDGSYYPRCPKLQAELPFAINHLLKMNATTSFDELFVAMREIYIDNGEVAVLRVLALFMSTPKLSPEGRSHVERTRICYLDALYAYIRQSRPELTERKIAIRVAKILLLLPLFKKIALDQNNSIQSLAVCNVVEDLHGLPYEVHSPNLSAYE